MNRRQFLASAGAACAALADREAQAQPGSAPAKVPTVVLGRTGKRVSKLGFGGSWNVDMGVLAAGVDRGISYFDTAEGYGSGQSERAMGAFIADSCRRDDIYVVTKTFHYGDLEQALAGSLQRLRMDHVDTLYLHDVRDPAHLTVPSVKEAAERLKRAGKIRYFGFSCHHPPCLEEALQTGASMGFYDVCMFRYSFRDRDRDAFNRAIDSCTKARMGLVAMKTLNDPAHIPAKYDLFTQAGLNKVQSALKAIWADGRMHAVVSEMINVDHIQQNCDAAAKQLTQAEDKMLRRYAALTDHLYCRGCEHLCRTAAGSTVAVADILRYHMYHDRYGKRVRARELYAALPTDSRDIHSGDWVAGEAACPHGVPIRRLLQAAEQALG